MSERNASRSVVVSNPNGLHLRPWGQFAELAHRFQSRVVVCNGGTRADGRSTMDLMTLAATAGSELRIEAEGDDADQAVAALADFIEKLREDLENAKQDTSG